MTEAANEGAFVRSWMDLQAVDFYMHMYAMYDKWNELEVK